MLRPSFGTSSSSLCLTKEGFCDPLPIEPILTIRWRESKRSPNRKAPQGDPAQDASLTYELTRGRTIPCWRERGRKHHCWGQNCHSSFDYKQALPFLLPFLSSLFSVSLDSPSFPSAMAASPPCSWTPLHLRCLGRWSPSQARNPILNLFPLYDPMIKQFLALILKKMFLVSLFPHWFGAIPIQFFTQ